jgi:hypothetical protein
MYTNDAIAPGCRQQGLREKMDETALSEVPEWRACKGLKAYKVYTALPEFKGFKVLPEFKEFKVRLVCRGIQVGIKWSNISRWIVVDILIFGTNLNLGIFAGRDGTDGKDGRDGVEGKDGKDGQDGAPGMTGNAIHHIHVVEIYRRCFITPLRCY